MNWVRQYEGPFLIVKMSSSLTTKLQRTPQLPFGWPPNGPVSVQSIPDLPSGVLSYNLSPEAESFVSGRREHATPKQQTAKKRRSRHQRRSAGNTKTLPNNVLDEASGMAKTSTVDVSCETETKSLADSNGVSKAKTLKENSFDGGTRTKDYTVDDR